jgi:argininosuccinate lyase
MMILVETHCLKQRIYDGLSRVLEEWESGSFVCQESDEDIHTANERRLSELVGPVAGERLPSVPAMFWETIPLI